MLILLRLFREYSRSSWRQNQESHAEARNFCQRRRSTTRISWKV